MNKKITLYELLGLVKDGQAPKKIKLNEEIYTLQNDIENCYIDYVGVEKETNVQFYLTSYIGNNYISDIFTTQIEIIEEENNFTGWKMYQEGKEVCSFDCSTRDEKKIEKLSKEGTHWISEIPVIDKINEIIDELNKIKEDKE